MPQAILYPVFVQVALTFVLLYCLGSARVRSVRSGETKLKEGADNSSAWPDHVLKIANAFGNQFQLPVLFYVLAVLALVTNQVDVVLVALAWVFAGLRVIHAVIHTTSNRIRHRFWVFTLGFAVLLAMWVYFGVQIQVSR